MYKNQSDSDRQPERWRGILCSSIWEGVMARVSRESLIQHLSDAVSGYRITSASVPVVYVHIRRRSVAQHCLLAAVNHPGLQAHCSQHAFLPTPTTECWRWANDVIEWE